MKNGADLYHPSDDPNYLFMYLFASTHLSVKSLCLKCTWCASLTNWQGVWEWWCQQQVDHLGSVASVIAYQSFPSPEWATPALLLSITYTRHIHTTVLCLLHGILNKISLRTKRHSEAVMNVFFSALKNWHLSLAAGFVKEPSLNSLI